MVGEGAEEGREEGGETGMSGLSEFVCGEYKIPVVIDERALKGAVILTPELVAATIEQMKAHPARFPLCRPLIETYTMGGETHGKGQEETGEETRREEVLDQ